MVRCTQHTLRVQQQQQQQNTTHNIQKYRVPTDNFFQINVGSKIFGIGTGDVTSGVIMDPSKSTVWYNIGFCGVPVAYQSNERYNTGCCAMKKR